ncbi:MAG: hypothetical protein HY744_07050 [Deltaproteobacteria bacterium]|nr:hypothetical protein [Deltaproteobacteria bacterium]
MARRKPGTSSPKRRRQLVCALGAAVAAAVLVGQVVPACAAGSETAPFGVPVGPSPGDGGGEPDAEPPDGESPDGGFEPVANPCQDHPGEIVCAKNAALTCDQAGEVAGEKSCGDEVCVPGTGCVPCIQGQFSCYGNQVRSCNTSVQPPQWDVVATCDPTAPTRCSAATGACAPLVPIGNGPDKPTGKYYQYAFFTTGNSPYKGGCDVDAYGNFIYVNRGPWYADGEWLDVYTVELLDSDGDGKLEPNQHPDNPEEPGPVEQRVLTYVTSYHVPLLGMVHHSEIFAVADRAYHLGGPWNPGIVYEYVFGTGVANAVATGAPAIDIAQMGLDETTGTWYAANEGARRVYSFHKPTAAWVAEFAYPDLAGSHMDGMDVVTDPNTGTGYVYVSDMTSDYIGQYRRDRGGDWVQVNLFAYAGSGEYVEGMGFGVLNHFWMGGDASSLYEVGGGDIQKYTEPQKPPR